MHAQVHWGLHSVAEMDATTRFSNDLTFFHTINHLSPFSELCNVLNRMDTWVSQIGHKVFHHGMVMFTSGVTIAHCRLFPGIE